MSFLPVPEYEGIYEVSEDGEVRSLDRKVQGRDGTIYPFKGKILQASLNSQNGYPQVSLWKNGIGTSHYVHRLVAVVHIPNPGGLPEVNHKNGIRHDCRRANLEWVTSSGNSYHASDTGLRVYTNRMTEAEFMTCLQDVIDGESYGSLSKRVPYEVPFLSVKLRKLARKYGLEDLLNQSLKSQAAQRARINGAKNR